MSKTEDTLIIYKQGSRLRLGNDLPVIVTACFIRGGQVYYEVVYWDGKERKVETVCDFELTRHPQEENFGHQSIGFHQ